MSLRFVLWAFALLASGVLSARADDTEAAVHQVFESEWLENTKLRYVKDSGRPAQSYVVFLCLQ